MVVAVVWVAGVDAPLHAVVREDCSEGAAGDGGKEVCVAATPGAETTCPPALQVLHGCMMGADAVREEGGGQRVHPGLALEPRVEAVVQSRIVMSVIAVVVWKAHGDRYLGWAMGLDLPWLLETRSLVVEGEVAVAHGSPVVGPPLEVGEELGVELVAAEGFGLVLFVDER